MYRAYENNGECMHAEDNVCDLTCENSESHYNAEVYVVDCVTYKEQSYFADVRCLYSGKPKDGIDIVVKDEDGREPIRVTRRSCMRIPQRDSAGFLQRSYEEQFIVEVPADFEMFFIDCIDCSTGQVIAHDEAGRDYWHGRRIFEFREKAKNPFADEQYGEWLENQRPSADELSLQREASFENAPLMSVVVPVYRTNPDYLKTMLDSVLAQSYANWELILVNASPDDEGVSAALSQYDDARIRILDHPENDGINGNTNFGIAAATGDYVGFLDHDDYIEPDLLFEYAKAINENEDSGLLYCDEDSFEEEGKFILPLFKPDASLDLLYSNNYVLHLLMVSRDVLDKTERSESAMNGAQDYDLTLQTFQLGVNVVHVPKVLYHWRIHEESSNVGNAGAKSYATEAAIHALETHFDQRGLDADVSETDIFAVYRSVFKPKCSAESVMLVRDREADAYGGSVHKRNARAKKADGEILLFASASTKIGSDEELNAMLGYFEREEIGMLAPRLVCSSGLVSQTGLVVCRDASLTYMGRGMPVADDGYIGRFHRPCNFSAVTGECCMIRRADFEQAGGYDESFKTLLYANVDLCLRLRELGKLVTYTPFASFEHVPSMLSPFGGFTERHEHMIEHDKALLLEKWPTLATSTDPFFNPNLDEKNPYFVIAH